MLPYSDYTLASSVTAHFNRGCTPLRVMQDNSVLYLSVTEVLYPSSPQMAALRGVLMEDQTDYRSDYRSDRSKHSVTVTFCSLPLYIN